MDMKVSPSPMSHVRIVLLHRHKMKGALDNARSMKGGGGRVVTGRVGGLDGWCVAVRVDEAGYDGFTNVVSAGGKGAKCDEVAWFELVFRNVDGGGGGRAGRHK